MIAYLRGRIAILAEDHVVLDVQGVGYLVHASARTLRRLPAVGETAELHVETQMREDSITLYGFIDQAERGWFKLLQTVQGVGARVALSILGVLGPDQLATAIAAQDRGSLTRASGVGARLAARILSELRERVGELPATLAAAEGIGPVAPVAGATADALSALVNLGYARAEAFTALRRVHSRLGETSVDALIREGLKELAR